MRSIIFLSLSEYLMKNLTWEAAGNGQLRENIINEFFAMHPDYKDVPAFSSRSVKHFADTNAEPKEIKQEDLFRQEIQETDYITNTVEFYITYYDDGSFVLGTLTSRRTEDPNS